MTGVWLRKMFGKSMAKLLLFMVVGSVVLAEEPVAVDTVTAAVNAASEELQTNMNIIWTCMAAFLVFFMQAG